MSASDHLSIELFHGTHIPLPASTKRIKPFVQGEGSYEGQRVAFATSSLEEAQQYGSHVFQVAPDEHTQEGWGSTYYSPKGFKVIKKL